MGIKQKLKGWIHSLISMTKEEKIYPVPVLTDKEKLLANKVALITGGSGGIGLAMAEAFLRSGAKVILAGTNERKLKDCLERLAEWRESIKYLVIDVLNVSELPEKVQAASELFPDGRIDILINSAGIVSHSDFFHMSEQEYDRIMDINAKGTYFMSQTVGQFMIKNKIRGHILNVTSSSALRPAWTPYQMSKWAVRGLTLGLADVLLPYGIVVNAIAPGPTATPMLGKNEGDTIYNPTNPAGRYVIPSEIAALAVFMVSDMGNMIVGDTFYMTGGSGTITMHH